jgi:hypothetical protein
MSEPMTKQRLLERMDASYVAWEQLLAEVGPERMLIPGAEGDWSVKDIVAHTASWQRRVVSRLRRAPDESAGPDPLAGLDTDARNARFYAENRALTLEEALTRSRAAHAELVECVAALSEEALVRPGYFEWAGSEPLWPWIADNDFQHYDEHAVSIRQWLAHQPTVAAS